MDSLDTNKKHLFVKHNVLINFNIQKRISLRQYINAYKDIAANARSIDEVQMLEDKHFGNKHMETIPGVVIPSKMLNRNIRGQTGQKIAEFLHAITQNPDDWMEILAQAEDMLFDYDDEWDWDDEGDFSDFDDDDDEDE